MRSTTRTTTRRRPSRSRKKLGPIARIGIIAALGLGIWIAVDDRDMALLRIQQVIAMIDGKAIPSGGATAPSGKTLAGEARISDGDTLRIGDTRIRLHGVDAPETDQLCYIDGAQWQCGLASMNALIEKVAGRPVTCSERDTDQYGRVVGECFAGGDNLNAWMVSQGWAVSYRQYSRDYIPLEEIARADRRGIWASEFDMPWDYRRAGRQ